MTSLVAAIVSWWVFIAGMAVGYFFGDYIKGLVLKAVANVWDFAKHAVVDFYATIKNKFFP